MDVDLYHRKPDTSAEDRPKPALNVVRIETTVEANDGQQYKVTVLDADDSFDIVVKYPNTESEIVWSLYRERELI